MIVVYRDSLGYVQLEVDFDGISFIDNCACFCSDGREYKIPVKMLIGIGAM